MTSIDWSKAPDDATHYSIKESGPIWFKGNYSFWKIWSDSEWEVIGLPASELTPIPPQPKRLAQAVFDGLPPEYRWAAVDANAKACAYTDDPEHDEEIGIFGYFNCTDRAGADYIEIGYGYDATDWQDSKIERETQDDRVANAQDWLEIMQGDDPEPRTAQDIVQAAVAHMDNRAATYDQPQGERSMARAVAAFNAITGQSLAESDGWLFLQLLKDARQWSRPDYHQDSAEDCIAYAALKAEALESGK